MILRAARSSRALATDLLSLLAAGAGLAFEFNFDDEGEDGPPAPTGGRSPGALAAARVQGEAQRIFPACVRDGQSSKTIPWVRRRVSATIRTCCRLSRWCQLLRAARNARGCMGTRVFWAPSRDFLAQKSS